MSNNSNDKLTLLHLLSATAANNTTPSTKADAAVETGSTSTYVPADNRLDTTTETRELKREQPTKNIDFNIQQENPKVVNRTVQTAVETDADTSLDLASRSAKTNANMRTFASNVKENTTAAMSAIDADEVQAVIMEEEINYQDEEVALKDELDTTLENPILTIEPLSHEQEATLPIEEPTPETVVETEADEPVTYFDDPDNFDAEDIDEAYRKRLIALGLEPLEPIMTSEATKPEEPIIAAEPATATLSSKVDLEVVEEEAEEVENNPAIDDALTDLFANPPVVPLPKTPEVTEELPTDTHFSPLNFQVDESKTTATATSDTLNKTASKASMLQQFRQLQDRNSTFVFMFGRQQAGKTVILSSLAYHMGVDENGLLETRRRVDNLKGAAYLKQLSQSVRKGQFMNRTAVGSLYELDLTYTPNKPEVPMNFTFLEMSGEDLSKVELSESSAGQLPNDIDVYLKCPNLNLVFMMVVPYEDAEEHDYLVIDFLDYLKERKPDIDYSKILLLISKWDRYEGLRKNEVDLFVKEQMPRTYSRLKAKKATIARYSIGEVSEDGESITELNSERPEVIKKWMYHATTGQRIKDENSSIWSKFKKWM